MRPELAEVLPLLRKEDPNALERALALLQSTVFSFSMKMCGHRQDAEDTSQEVLVRALPYLRKFDTPEAMASWLYKATRNFCVSSRRQSKFAPDAAHRLSLDELMPSGRELEELLAADDLSAESRVVRGEAGERVRRALLKLPPEYRVILVLHDMEGMHAPEVGEIVGIKSGTVRVRLHRARLFLRKELNRPRGPRKKPQTMQRGRGCRGMFAALSDYLDGMIDDATCDEMQIHIKDCAPCQAFVDSLRRTVEQCRGYQPECSAQRFQSFRKQLVRQYLEASSVLKKSKARRPNPAR
jgi:RNA polymerase sigma-70 factor, ECF subfamily